MKIKSDISVELTERYDRNYSTQILHIHPHSDNKTEWTALSIEDTDPGHFDKNPERSVKIIFDNINLDAIIHALTLYRDNMNSVNNA
jgi:hypothetical protein